MCNCNGECPTKATLESFEEAAKVYLKMIELIIKDAGIPEEALPLYESNAKDAIGI